MHIHISKNPLRLRPTLVFLFVLSIALIIEFPLAHIPSISLVKDAEARIGRPASPNSVAGVRRRTRRRTSRRIAAGTRVRTLPAGCTKVIRRGVTYHSCGGVYYRPSYEGNNVVYVVVDNP
jgi:hypothetical protein